MEHTLSVRIYYEDTDSLGIVYHANYLKYFERGRTEFLEEQGKAIAQWNQDGFNFAVYEMKIKFKQAARLGDICTVKTIPMTSDSEYRKKLKQILEKDGDVITEAEVDLVCVDNSFKLRAFPEGIFS